jgi:GntR family transcriptional repressor for pyruvate dehydrogenase complex
MRSAVQVPKAADAIAQHLEKLILEGALRPGERLAGERELAEKFEISRPTLRAAIAQLTERGLLMTSRKGTRVAEFLAPLMAPLVTLLADNPAVTDDYFEFRICIEAEAAGLAATRATDIDRSNIEEAIARMRDAHELNEPTAEANADVEFHLAVYEASHNLVVLHIMRAMSELLRRDVFYNRAQLYARKGVRDALLEQHLAIGAAICAGDGGLATKAAGDHIRYTSQKIEEIRRGSARMEAALHRVGRTDLIAADD